MEFIGTYEAVSIGSMPVSGTDEDGNDTFDPSGTRSITLMNRPGDESDPYGGWKQRGSLHDIRVVELPDGREVEPDEWPALGYDDDKWYKVHAANGRAKVQHA